MKINIQATVTFYKVIVLSIGLCESEIMNERTCCSYCGGVDHELDVLQQRN